MNRRKVFRTLKWVVLVYCSIGILVYLLQDYILLRSIALSPDYQYQFNQPFDEVNIPYDPKTNINLLRFTTEQSPKGILLYFHGNRTNVSRYRRFVPFFTRSGYEVWMMDYPGYGKSTGKFSEKLVYEWSLLVYKLARQRYPPNRIVIYGKSLGTGVASQLASVRNCRFLILESPYYSLPSIFKYYLPIYPMDRIIKHQFPTYKFLPKVTDPIIIFHGTNDWVVPYRNSKNLQPLLKPGDRLITLEGGTHHNLFSFPLVPATIDSLLAP